MQRLDPQDAGAGYRNMIGVPGGMNSPLMKVIEEENVNGMKLVSGEGNKPNAKPTEEDVFNSVWIYGEFILIFVTVWEIRLMTSRVFCLQRRCFDGWDSDPARRGCDVGDYVGGGE